MECIKKSPATPGYGNAWSQAHAAEPPNGKVIFFPADGNGAARAAKLLMPRLDTGRAFRIYSHSTSEFAFQSRAFPVKAGIYSTGGFLSSPAISRQRPLSKSELAVEAGSQGCSWGAVVCAKHPKKKHFHKKILQRCKALCA